MPTETILGLIWLIIVIVLSIIMFCLFLYDVISTTIHKNYHKGYNECRNDEINYYQTLRDLDEKFTEIMKSIMDTELEMNVNLITELIDFGNTIRKFKKKY